MNAMDFGHSSSHYNFKSSNQWRDVEDVHYCNFCFGSYFIYRYCVYCWRKFCPFPKCPMFWKNHACDQVFFTNQCSKTSTSEVHYLQHYEMHAKPDLPVYDVFRNGTLHTNSSAKRQHRTQHKIFQCNQCNKNFVRKSHLQRHLGTHSGKRSFTCHVCEKSFIRDDHLSSHLLTHGGKKKFTCPTCGKSFHRNYSLTVHIRVHTAEKPYKCDFCNLCFSHSSNRTKHCRAQHSQIIVQM